MGQLKDTAEGFGVMFGFLYMVAFPVMIVFVILRATDEMSGGFWTITSPLWGTAVVHVGVIAMLFVVGLIGVIAKLIFPKLRKKSALDEAYEALQEDGDEQ